MSSRPRLLPSLLFLIVVPLRADWLVDVDTICSPGGIAVKDDRVTVMACEQLVVLNADGTYRGSRAVDRRALSGFHVEKMSPAKHGFIASGYDLNESLELHPVVVRLDEKGDVQWTRRIRTKSTNRANLAVEASNGDVVAASQRDDAVLIVRFSPAGDVKSSALVDRTDVDSPTGLVATRDSGMLVLSSVRKRSAGVTRFAADGKVQWDVVLGSATNGGFLYDAVELADGGFIAVGRSRNYTTTDRSGWIVRFSKSGQVVWQKLVGGEGEDGLFTVTRLSDTEVVAVGGTTSVAGNPDTWMVFLSLDGTVQRELALGTAAEDGPTDNRRDVAAVAVNGEIVFASVARLKLFTGRVRAASPACPHTRAVRSNVTDGVAAVENEGTPLLIDPSITVEPMSIKTQETWTRITRLCEWTASDATVPEVRIAAAAASEEDAFAGEVAALLFARKFAELDALAADLRKNRKVFDSGASKLRGFYDALAQHSRLTGLGDAEQIVRSWFLPTAERVRMIAATAATTMRYVRLLVMTSSFMTGKTQSAQPSYTRAAVMQLC